MEQPKRDRALAHAFVAFTKHGFKRLSMQDLANHMGVSRGTLYLWFKDKEEVFKATTRYYANGLIKEIEADIGKKKTAEDRILFAFEIWAIKDFEKHRFSPEALEIVEGYKSFAKEEYEEAHQKFEGVVSAQLKILFKLEPERKILAADRLAHLIVASSRGFKLYAKNGEDLRRMIQDHLRIVLRK